MGERRNRDNSRQGIAPSVAAAIPKTMTDQSFGSALRDARRRRGMSQLELATRAATTQRHVSFLEGARSVPGRNVVSRLADALDLPPREHNELLSSAGFAPRFMHTRLDDPALATVLTTLDHILRGMLPYPAMVIDRQGTLVASNDAFSVLTDDAAPELLEAPVNVYRLALAPNGMAARTRNLPEWSAHILERMRRDLARDPDPTRAELLRELEGYLGDRAAADAPATGFAVPLLLEHRGEVLSLLTTVTSFATAVDVTVAELKLEAFLPANEATRRCLESIVYDNRAESPAFE